MSVCVCVCVYLLYIVIGLLNKKSVVLSVIGPIRCWSVYCVFM